jgi:hypothetical protein
MPSLSDLRSVDPYEFEEVVAKVWDSKGYNTNLRKKSNDKGVDVEATSGNHKVLIQAKRYADGNKVGGPDVRKYATLYQQDPSANQVIIVTTGSFTSQAKEIAAEQNVKIINGQEFIDMVSNYNINLDSADKGVLGDTESTEDPEPDTIVNPLALHFMAILLLIPILFLTIIPWTAIFGDSVVILFLDYLIAYMLVRRIFV